MNAYTTLGLNPGCTDDEVKSAYRTLVSVHHPDAGGDQSTFRAIDAAYQLVRTITARRSYDTARQQRVVDDLVHSTARIVEDFFEACAPRMEERK